MSGEVASKIPASTAVGIFPSALPIVSCVTSLTSNQHPIGIFDSGIGGWSVLREIRRELPQESLIYVADSAYAPYGDRAPAVIAARARAIAVYLQNAGAKALVVACNTATTAAVAELRTRYALPIVAMEPAVKPAAAQTRSGVIGVLATQRTVDSAQLARLRQQYGREVEILAQPAPGLVECIEAGDFTAPRTRELVAAYIRPLVDFGADVLVLGCTHYPLIRDLIEEEAGPTCTVIDPAPAVARELRRRLTAAALLANGEPQVSRVYTTGQAPAMRELLRLLGEPGLEPMAVTIGGGSTLS